MIFKHLNQRLNIIASTELGAAFIGVLTINLFSKLDNLRKILMFDRKFIPKMKMDVINKIYTIS